jgi:hypothetical protein
MVEATVLTDLPGDTVFVSKPCGLDVIATMVGEMTSQKVSGSSEGRLDSRGDARFECLDRLVSGLEVALELDLDPADDHLIEEPANDRPSADRT